MMMKLGRTEASCEVVFMACFGIRFAALTSRAKAIVVSPTKSRRFMNFSFGSL
jgi:hypothetical protein